MIRMTIDQERFRAIDNTRKFLYELFNPKNPIPKAINLRRKAYVLLKHYPEEFWMDDLQRRYGGH